MSFPDIENALMDWIATLPDVRGVGNETPANLDDRLPFVVVARVGGPDDFFNDYPTVDVDVFGPNRNTAYDVAQSIRAGLQAPLLIAGGVVIDSVDTRVGPRKLPWENPAIRRFGATYQLGVRRR